VLVRNGEAAAPWLSKQELLKDFAGAYTTARTVDGTAVFELSIHCSRLHDTATAVWERELAGGEASKTAAACHTAHSFMKTEGPLGLKPLLRHEIGLALEFLGVCGGSGGAAREEGVDYQVTVVLTAETVGAHTPADRGFDIFTFVQPLPTIEPMVDVLAHRADRSNPTIKDVQWVRDRKSLEDLQQQAGVNEVLMFDSSGAVTEGLQTNFFAVTKDGAVLTAPDELVLAGTVRKVVLEVAQRSGIPVRFEGPNIHNLDQWESCFICSTSRLVKPIRLVEAPEFEARKSFPAQNSVAHRLEELVLDAFRSHAEPLIGTGKSAVRPRGASG